MAWKYYATTVWWYSLHCGNHICRLFHAIPNNAVPLQLDAAVVLLWESSVLNLTSVAMFALELWCHQILQFQHEFWKQRKVIWRIVSLDEVFVKGFSIYPVGRHGATSSAMSYVWILFHCCGIIQISSQISSQVINSHTSAFVNNCLDLCHILINFACAWMSWMLHVVDCCRSSFELGKSVKLCSVYCFLFVSNF